MSVFLLECLHGSESPEQTRLLHSSPCAEQQYIIKADHFLFNGKQALEAVACACTQLGEGSGILITFMLDENFGSDFTDPLGISN